MDARLVEARNTLKAYEDNLKCLYPDMISLGTPCYTLPPRVSFLMKLEGGKTKCTLASRLLLEIKLGRRLNTSETCDHINGDTTDDSFDNLQVLSCTDNARKGPSVSVLLAQKQKLSKLRKGVPAPHNQGSNNGRAKLSDAQVAAIRERTTPYTRGLDDILAREYGVSRRLISAIRHNKQRTSSTPAWGT